MKKKRIIVTGGSGFIGSSLIRRLLEENYENIVVFDHNRFNSNEIKSVIGDFMETEKLSKIIKRGDVVMHMACSSVPATSEKERIKDIEENIIGSIRLFDVCVKKGINKLIFISSGGTVYGDCGKKALKETDRNRPVNSHGVMKLAIEKYLEVYSRIYGMKYIIARIANPYGKLSSGKKRQGIIDTIIERMMKDKEIEIWGDGKITRDYIFIDDVTEFLMKTVKKTSIEGIFNVGTGFGASINEILEIIKKVSGKNIRVKYLKKRIFDTPYSVLDINKAKKELGWSPKFTLEEGIKKVCENIAGKIEMN